jgi:ABC-type Fe3+-hydroxamate transport system substrate-binding protein
MQTSEPKRIVSLVPSDTYTVIRLGLGDRLVGRTVYCVEPEVEVAGIETVGGTKNADVARILELQPDLVIANKEENRRHDIERLQEAGLPVVLSFPRTVEQGLEHVERLLALFPSIAFDLAPARARVQRLASRRVDALPAFVPIWMSPLMTVHADTFISDALELCGGRNVFADRKRRYPLSADLGLRPPIEASDRDERYPRVTLEEVALRAPQLALLPDEPHEFTDADAAVFRDLGIPHVAFCDGKDLMWYGLRSLEGLDRIAALIDGAR